MEILSHTGRPDLAQIFVAKMRDNADFMVEFVDACDPTVGDRRRKWVIVISTQFGCPVKCLMCDAGGAFKGNLTFQEISSQVETVVAAHGDIDPGQCDKLKIQFARMGEPSLNDAVLEVLAWLKDFCPTVIPCIATITPAGREAWFAELLKIRDCFRDFQLQLSVNSTDDAYRDKLMPYPKMSWEWMAEYGREFHRKGQRTVCLNFALSPEIPVSAAATREYFDPEHFVVKLTPLNPTTTAEENGMSPADNRADAECRVACKAEEFLRLGFSVIESIGDMEENLIGSNCGQAVRKLRLASW
ncbi:MAG: radical SAM protein [Desulfomonile tiedjei]|nr:radical SAM protein [Desulfomonile tiedjei]